VPHDSNRRPWNVLQPIWRFRSFVLGGVRRELALRYSGSLLGGAWQILGPATTIAIYTIVFAEVMRARLPGVGDRFSYAIFVCVGIIAWNLFSELVLRSQTVFRDNANLIKKASFPRAVLLAIIMLSALASAGLFLGIFLVLLALLDRMPGWSLLAVLPLLALLCSIGVGLGLIAAVLNVFFKDVGQAMPLVLQFWFWLTPIVYSPAILPQSWRWVLDLNPLTPVFTGMQNVFLANQWPPTGSIVAPVILAAALLIAGFWIYRRAGPELVDEL
jgi:lipopolysaccharide transport system permease protein